VDYTLPVIIQSLEKMCGNRRAYVFFFAFFQFLFKLFAPHKRAKMDHAVSTQKRGIKWWMVVVLSILNVMNINKYEQRASATS